MATERKIQILAYVGWALLILWEATVIYINLHN